MGSSARGNVGVRFSAEGVEEVRRNIRLVRDEASRASQATREMGHEAGMFSHSAAIGVGELARGIGKVAEAGHVGAFALREFSGAAFRLGETLGPAGGLLGVLVVLGGAIVEIFTSARQQMEETRQKFEEELRTMVNAGNNAGLMKQAQDLYRGTPAGHFKDGIQELERQERDLQQRYNESGGITKAALKKQLDDVTAQLTPMRQQFAELRAAILDVNNTPLEIKGLPAVRSTAQRPGAGRGGTGRGRLRLGGATGGMSVSDLVKEVTGLYDMNADVREAEAAPGANINAAISASIATGIKQGAASVTESVSTFERTIQAAGERIHATVDKAFGQTLGEGIQNAFAAAFSGEGVGGAIQAFGRTILSGLGQVLTQLGQTYLEYGGIMQGLSDLLPNPFTAGPAAIAIGAALLALGGALQGVAAGHHGGGGGGYSAAPTSLSSGTGIIDRGLINPLNPLQPTRNVQAAGQMTPAAGGPVQIVVWNPNDAATQRTLTETLKRAGWRGNL